MADELETEPVRGDIIVHQLPGGSWQVQDHAGHALGRVEYDDPRDARDMAAGVAASRGGRVWVRSRQPRRFGLVGTL